MSAKLLGALCYEAWKPCLDTPSSPMTTTLIGKVHDIGIGLAQTITCLGQRAGAGRLPVVQPCCGTPRRRAPMPSSPCEPISTNPANPSRYQVYQGQFMILTNPLQTQGLALSLDATPPAFQAWGHTPPSQQPRCTHGISPVYPRCISHVDAINMGDTPGIYRSNTVAIPWRHRSDTGPGVVSSLEGTQGADPS